MPVCTKRCKIVSLIIIIVCLLTIGICAISLCKTLYHQILHKELGIANHSTGYEMWKETPIPMYLNLYLFNWTNAEEVLQDWTIKPIFEEHGPYVFSEHHIRVNLTWNECDNTVTYYQKRIWHFEPDLSVGTLQDNITNLNVIAATAGYLIRKKPSIVQRFAGYFIELKERELVQTKTVAEWTFEGYDDKLLTVLGKLNITGFNIPYSKFGWFYGRNNSDTYDGNFTMYTGTDNIELLGIFNKWNGASWTGDYTSYCGVVNGTSGELWPPVKKYDRVAIFSSDLCSTVWLSHQSNYSNETVGLVGKKYVGTDFDFDNGTKYPEQKCFTGDQSFPSGVRDVSTCKFGAPAFVSYPHFYLADSNYTSSIRGMNPSKEQHEFFIVLEPNTGIPLEVRATMQLNLLIQPIHSINMFKNVKPTFVPMLWFSQTAELSENLGNKAKLLLTIPSILSYSGFGLIAIAALLIFIAVYLTYKSAWVSKEEERLLIETS